MSVAYMSLLNTQYIKSFEKYHFTSKLTVI